MPDMYSLVHGQSVNMISAVSISSTSLMSLDVRRSFPEKIPSQNHPNIKGHVHHFIFIYFYFIIRVFAFVNACIVNMCPMLPEGIEDISFPETGIANGCEPPCGY